MTSKKLEDLSVDELMVIAKKPLSKKTRVVSSKLSHLEEIKQFILSEDIKSHPTIAVPAIMIYERYKKWCGLNNMDVRGRNIFFKEFKNHFKQNKIGGLVKYHITPDGFDLSDSNLIKLKNEKKKKS